MHGTSVLQTVLPGLLNTSINVLDFSSPIKDPTTNATIGVVCAVLKYATTTNIIKYNNIFSWAWIKEITIQLYTTSMESFSAELFIFNEVGLFIY